MDSRFIKAFGKAPDQSLVKTAAIRTKDEFVFLTPEESFLAVGVIRMIRKLSSDDLKQLCDESEEVFKWLA